VTRFRNPLDHVQVAAPCKADWDQMIGSERMRFCGQCNLNVYNLSGMTRSEAESLIARNEGGLCVRFYRRFDGSIITRDCPIGLRAIRRRVSYLTKALAAAGLTFLASIGFHELVPVTPAFIPPRTMGAIALHPDRNPVVVGAIPPVGHREPETKGRIVIGETRRRGKRQL
jgi:hypothetical protein